MMSFRRCRVNSMDATTCVKKRKLPIHLTGAQYLQAVPIAPSS